MLGEHAELPAVAALAGLEEQAVAAATGELARAEILRPDPPLGFVHPLVRDAVYRELPPGERALLHERAAVLLRDAGAPSEQVAAQLLEAPRRGEAWVVDALEAAGATAMRRGAADSAVAPPAPRAGGAAAPRAPRAQVLVGLGTAEALTERPGGRRPPAEAYELIDDAARCARSVADGLARVLIFTGRPPAAAEARPRRARPRSRRARTSSRRCSRRSSWPRTTSAAGSRRPCSSASPRTGAPAPAAAAARHGRRSTGRTAAATAGALLRARAGGARARRT